MWPDAQQHRAGSSLTKKRKLQFEGPKARGVCELKGGDTEPTLRPSGTFSPAAAPVPPSLRASVLAC